MLRNLDASRTWATFRMSGKDLNPDKVTAQLGITPSKAFRAGDQRGTNEGAIWKNGHWDISSEDHLSSRILQEHIEWLLDKLEPVQAQLQDLLSMSNVDADIFCYWEVTTFNAGISFSPSFLKRLAALNLGVGLDIYSDSDVLIAEE